ncbi:hypothetical protein PAPYR_13123 [Paratrimastix pyriformis]|uniref:Uncharacterized protein n=1 Tax=Paratrimastix pyriformis TaxID=342808 RepID=A0ABQ8U0S4_9EUKA|nr:hypothetical protein PAPYR_13123 [Paratrimastix pyriformis]
MGKHVAILAVSHGPHADFPAGAGPTHEWPLHQRCIRPHPPTPPSPFSSPATQALLQSELAGLSQHEFDEAHWKKELAALCNDLAHLRAQLRNARPRFGSAEQSSRGGAG